MIFGESAGGSIETALENIPGDELLAKVVNLALKSCWRNRGAEGPKKEVEEEKKTKKLEKQIEALHFATQISKVTELYDNDYKNLLLLLTVLAPEYLFDRILLYIKKG